MTAAASPSYPAASCRSDPELMFPLLESRRAGQRTGEECVALAICHSCALLAPCRRMVVAQLHSAPMRHGVAGGLTAAERASLARTRRQSGRPTIVSAVEAVIGAQRRAGAPPIDPVAVERLLAGHPLRKPTRWELAAAAMVLTEHERRPVHQVARVLGEHERTVWRWRNRFRQGAVLVGRAPALKQPA